MATQPKKMNIIKQVLTGHKNGLSVRKMAEMYSMSPTTVQRYLKMANEASHDNASSLGRVPKRRS